jgi:hypothetical protein
MTCVKAVAIETLFDLAGQKEKRHPRAACSHGLRPAGEETARVKLDQAFWSAPLIVICGYLSSSWLSIGKGEGFVSAYRPNLAAGFSQNNEPSRM